MKKNTMPILLAIFIAAISFNVFAGKVEIQSGTAHANDAQTIERFEAKYVKVLTAIQNSSSYKRIPLEDKDVTWFNTMAFKLWDKQTTKEQYMSTGRNRFPGYDESFEFLANKFLY